MHTIWEPHRCETRSLPIPAAPADVVRFLADPLNIPRWAPAFATEVRPDGDAWIAATRDGDARIVVESSDAAGTVDILAAGDRTRGAFARVIPNGEGSEMLFTLFFPPGTGEAAVAAQMATVDGELVAVRDHVAG